MQLTSSPRRALGLLAVGALGMSTAVIGVAGPASAAPSSYTFSTDPTAPVDFPGVDHVEVGAGCIINWALRGGAGGAGFDEGSPRDGEAGGIYSVTTMSSSGGARYDLFPGSAGADADVNEASPGAGGTHGASTSTGFGTSGVTDGATILGGGGGAASFVEVGGDYILAAYGGDGALSDGTDGIGGLDGEHFASSGITGGTDLGASNTGDGVISGGVSCPVVPPPPTGSAPTAPALQSWVAVGDGKATVTFTPGEHSYGAKTVWEYQLDGDEWTPFDPGFTNTDDLTLSLSKLTNLKTYKVSIRAVNGVGIGAAGTAVSFTPYREVAAPTNVTVTAGVSSVTVSWAPPADATGIAKYRVGVLPDGAQSSSGLVTCLTKDATATSCVLGVKPGLKYQASVRGVDVGGNGGEPAWSEAATSVVPGPSIATTVPKADGTLTSDAKDGKSVAGGQVTISGTGFLPGSTVALVVYSTPVKLGEAIVLADGTFSATVTLPKDLHNGVHNLVATGVDANGNTRTLVVEVAVSGGTAVLAKTGFSALPYAGAGALALLAGAGLIVAARRRSAA